MGSFNGGICLAPCELIGRRILSTLDVSRGLLLVLKAHSHRQHDETRQLHRAGVGGVNWDERLPYCPLSNAFEAATRAYRHRANGTASENGIDKQTDGQTDDSIAVGPRDKRPST